MARYGELNSVPLQVLDLPSRHYFEVPHCMKRALKVLLERLSFREARMVSGHGEPGQ